jgi:hypothetical protein
MQVMKAAATNQKQDMGRLKAIGHSPLTPLIGAALAAAGAAALIGFAFVARVSLPEGSAVDRTLVSSHPGTIPGAINLPTPSPEAQSGDQGSPTLDAGSATGGTLSLTPTGLDTTSPPVAPIPVDDGVVLQPVGRGGAGPSLGRGLTGAPRSDGTVGAGKIGKGHTKTHPKHDRKLSDDDGWSSRIDGKSKGKSAGEWDGGSYGKSASGQKATKQHKSHDADRGKGHSKSKGRGHSKHSHGSGR